MRSIRTAAAVVPVVLLLTGVSFAAKDLVGATAPEFNLKDLKGKPHALKDFAGKTVVLEWCNKDCPVWKGVIDELESTRKGYEKKGVVWISIDSTNFMKPDDVHAYMEKHKMADRIVLDDRDGKTGKAYDARTTPHMFIIDKDGKVAYDGAIDNKKPGKDHVNYVSQALDELLAGKKVSTPKTNPYGCSVKYKK